MTWQDTITTFQTNITTQIPVDTSAARTHNIETAKEPGVTHPGSVISYMSQAEGESLIDSVSVDTITVKPKEFGIMLEAPVPPAVGKVNNESFGMSYILLGLSLLFFIIGLRFRNNIKYVKVLLSNMIETRIRQNVFDETVRETFFLVLLNLLWSCSAGIVLHSFLLFTLSGNDPSGSLGIPSLTTSPALTIAICMGVSVLYTCFMGGSYLIVGNVFSDKVHATLWLKGYAATQGLLSVIFFPLSLLLLFYPQWTEVLLIIALASFILAKFIFIWKGFRIFFIQISSWVLFLYYLCSLEIVPLILTYLTAMQVCSLLPSDAAL